MKTTAPLQKVTDTSATAITTGKATHNPLQLKTAPVQQNPLQLKKENKTGLPDGLKAGVEALSGYSMDDVAVHYNSVKPAQLQAHAYAQGTDIHIAPGQEKHLPHEAWHVVQQKQGRVKATMQMKGGVRVNDNTALESEADNMGSRAAHHTQNSGFTQKSLNNEENQPAEGVAQLATQLNFHKDVTGNSRITATMHNRAGVHKVAADWVLNNGAWKTVPAGEYCNHSRDYNAMAQTILEAIHDQKLKNAAATVRDTYNELRDHDEGIGYATSTHAARMKDVIEDPDDVVNTDDIIDTFNYYIYKICDYPKNLFFWPARTGVEPDEPFGEEGDDPGNDWEVRNAVISDKRRLTIEKKRLKEGRDELRSALP